MDRKLDGLTGLRQLPIPCSVVSVWTVVEKAPLMLQGRHGSERVVTGDISKVHRSLFFVVFWFYSIFTPFIRKNILWMGHDGICSNIQVSLESLLKGLIKKMHEAHWYMPAESTKESASSL